MYNVIHLHSFMPFSNMCKIVIDTGATSSLISIAFAKRVGLIVSPTQHAARQLDKSSIRVSGETKFKISFGYFRAIS